jgi:predicted ferric reductase
LNDDFLRTFTVSSRQGALDDHDQFEITIRKVGPVTQHLFRHNVRADLEVPLQGFGGEFFIEQGAGENIAFVAGGVGITPLLAQAADLDLKRLLLYWTVRGDDLGLVFDTFDRMPGLAESTKLFVTGAVNGESDSWEKLEASGASLQKRRMAKDDLDGDAVIHWYLCTGTAFRNALVSWLDGKTVLYEDFNY